LVNLSFSCNLVLFSGTKIEFMKNSLSILFYLRKSKVEENEEAPIYVRITVNGKRVDLATHQFIERGRWDSLHGCIKGNKEDSRTINTHLDNIKSKILKVYTQLETSGKPITAEIIRNSISGHSGANQSLLKVFSLFNNQTKSRIGIDFEAGSFKRYESTYNQISKYLQSEYNRTDIQLEELDYKFISNYELYLHTQAKSKPNTISKNIGTLKRIVRLAVDHGYLEKNPFSAYKCPYKDPERNILFQDEIDKLLNKKLDSERLAVVRDMYIFSCYTGLSFADLSILKPSDISRGIDGEKWIIIHRKKTKERSPVPLLPIPLQIIEKYKNDPKCINKGVLLPMISNQHSNGYLKEIADLCGIQKVLTFHTARHTFATTVTLTNGVPIETVSKMLGHSSIRTTQIYSKVVDVKISEEMQTLKQKLAGNKKSEKGKVINL